MAAFEPTQATGNKANQSDAFLNVTIVVGKGKEKKEYKLGKGIGLSMSRHLDRSIIEAKKAAEAANKEFKLVLEGDVHLVENIDEKELITF